MNLLSGSVSSSSSSCCFILSLGPQFSLLSGHYFQNSVSTCGWKVLKLWKQTLDLASFITRPNSPPTSFHLIQNTIVFCQLRIEASSTDLHTTMLSGWTTNKQNHIHIIPRQQSDLKINKKIEMCKPRKGGQGQRKMSGPPVDICAHPVLPISVQQTPLCLRSSGWGWFDLTVVSLPGLSLFLFSPTAVDSQKVTDLLISSAKRGYATAGCLFVAAVCLSVWLLLKVMSRLLFNFPKRLLMSWVTDDSILMIFLDSTGTFDLSKIKAKLSESFSSLSFVFKMRVFWC